MNSLYDLILPRFLWFDEEGLWMYDMHEAADNPVSTIR